MDYGTAGTAMAVPVIVNATGLDPIVQHAQLNPNIVYKNRGSNWGGGGGGLHSEIYCAVKDIGNITLKG